MMTREHYQDQQSRVFYELSTLVLNLLRSPPTPSPASFLDQSPPLLADDVSTSRRRRPSSSSSYPQITPAGFASLMLGVSIALMLCGSVTFFLGFILMPWVIGLIMLLYVAGVLSTLSMLGRSIFCYATDPPPSPRKDIPAWKML